MEVSKLANLNQKILKLMLINLYKTLKSKDSENPNIYDMGDSDFWDGLEYVIRLMGFGDGEYEDYDFLAALYSENYHLIDESELKIDGDLEIPEVSEYSFDIDVHESVRQKVSYTHSMSSYSSDNVFLLFRKQEEDGYSNVYDGRITDTDVYDTETIDIEYNHRSLRKIN